MSLFLVQLRWELYRLARRPRTWLPFALVVVFNFGMSALLKLDPVRESIAKTIWKMHAKWDEAFSGLTTATHMLGEAFTVLGALGLALVAADIIAAENDNGTLRMIFSRPVGRLRIFSIKLITCIIYAGVLVVFIAASCLVAGLLFEGRGNLLMLATHEGIFGAFSFKEGLHRYALAIPFMWLSAVSGMLWAFLFTCMGMRTAAAMILALTLLTADTIVRTSPPTKSTAPYTLTTRLLTWRQVFNEEIPWGRIKRNTRELAMIDAALIALAFAAFRRMEIKRG